MRRFLAYDESVAIDKINNFYDKKLAQYDDDFYHQERPFRVALRIHYVETLNAGSDNSNSFYQWASTQGYYDVPEEALEHFRRHYYT